MKLLLTLSIFFLGVLCQPDTCIDQSVNLTCSGTGCTTYPVTVSGMCTTRFGLYVMACDLNSGSEYIEVFIDGVQYICNPNYNSRSFHFCGYYTTSTTSFWVYLRPSTAVRSCSNYGGVEGPFNVYGMISFLAEPGSFSVSPPVPTRSPTDPPTPNPTYLPPTIHPTSLPPTVFPTASPCVNKHHWCGVAETEGLCYDQDHETKILMINDCPVSCGTCLNSTLGPTSLPSLPPTLIPTFPTMSPSIKPSRSPTRLPTSLPTVSPTCIDTIRFCGLIESFCNSSNFETKVMMATDCASTCGSCTLEPTQTPTAVPTHPCTDSYAYCFALAQNGACYQENHHARLHFQNKCPVSCGTCNNKTVNPTSLPSPIPTVNPTTPTSAPSLSPSGKPSRHPTQIPTISPTCVDTITYCNVIESYCKNSDPGTLSKMITDCAATCGFCTLQPSRNPTISLSPSGRPNFSPTNRPSLLPTGSPSPLPTMSPIHPTITPSQLPSALPSVFPTAGPTRLPTNRPSKLPSNRPSATPSSQPSAPPTLFPTEIPSIKPSNSPTQCEDVFLFCHELALTGACYADDYDTRNEIHKDCPVSCDTCNNKTISPTASPSISPSASSSKQPSPLPTVVPTLEPTCADSIVYCRMITDFCSTSDPKTKMIMENQCAATCGFCIRLPSLNPTASPISVSNSTPSSNHSQPPEEGEPGYRNRKEAMDSISLSIFPSSVADSTQIETHFQLKSSYNVWITIFTLCMFVLVLAVIWKCRVLFFWEEKKNQGEFVKLIGDEMIRGIPERVCFSPMVMDANRDE